MAANQTHTPETSALSSELSAEQALGMIGMGLMQKLNHDGPGRWIWSHWPLEFFGWYIAIHKDS